MVKTAFCASIGKFWGEIFEKNTFSQFRIFRRKNFRFFGEISDNSVETPFFSCPWEHFEAKEFFRENILIFSGYWVTNFCLFVEKKNGGVIKTVFCESKWMFWGESYFWRTFFLSFPDIERKNFRLFFGSFSDGFVKTAFFVSMKTFSSKRFSFKNKIFFIFFGFCVTIFCLLVEKVDGIFKSTFYISTAKLWGKMFPLEEMWFLILVGQLTKFFRQFVEKIPKVSSKNCSICPKRKLCWKKGLEENFLSLADNERKTVGFLYKGFSRVVKTAFSASIEKFWGEFFWKEFFFTLVYSGEKISGFWRNFRHVCWNCVFFVSMRTLWGKRVFSRKNILIFFGYWVPNFCLFVRNERWN